MDESDDEMAEEARAPQFEEEEEEEIVESDIELEGETVEPDNDPPQKVCCWIWAKSPWVRLMTWKKRNNTSPQFS